MGSPLVDVVRDVVGDQVVAALELGMREVVRPVDVDLGHAAGPGVLVICVDEAGVDLVAVRSIWIIAS